MAIVIRVNTVSYNNKYVTTTLTETLLFQYCQSVHN